MKLRFCRQGLSIVTSGLARYDLPEFQVTVDKEILLNPAEELLRHLVDRTTRSSIKLTTNDTILYGYWLIKLIQYENWFLNVWENVPDLSKFVPGAKVTLTFWTDQRNLCKLYGSTFEPPRFDQLVVISDGVYQGEAIQGVRYPSPPHMSGWWITTDRYDGDLNSLKCEHLHHLTFHRPDIAPLLALNYGYRFFLDNGLDVWFDPEVASRSSD